MSTKSQQLSPLHAFTVHFPVAVIVIGFFIDCIGLSMPHDKHLTRMGYYLQCIGMVTVIIAWGTGHFFTTSLDGEAELARLIHQKYALASLVLIVFATLFRMVIVYLKKDNTRMKYVSLSLYLIAVVFVISAGYTGTTLVYNFLIGY